MRIKVGDLFLVLQDKHHWVTIKITRLDYIEGLGDSVYYHWKVITPNGWRENKRYKNTDDYNWDYTHFQQKMDKGQCKVLTYEQAVIEAL